MIYFFKIKLIENKSICIVFRKIIGIGLYKSYKMPTYLGFKINTKIKYLKKYEQSYFLKVLHFMEIKRAFYFGNILLDLQYKTYYNIRKLIKNGCYKGFRHKHGLPVHGQRTKCNGSTQFALYKKRLKFL